MEVAIKGLKSLLMVTFYAVFAKRPMNYRNMFSFFFIKNSCVEYILGLKICER